MDGGAAAAIEVLVQTLINVSKEEISLIRGLDNDVEQLKTTLGMIQSYLNDAEKKVITQEAVRTWLRELETLAFRADNVLDEFNYHLLHHKIKTSKVLPSFFSSFKHIARTLDVAQTIKQIDMDFKSLTQKSAVFGLEAMVVNAPDAVPDAAFETDSLTLDPIFIGRDDDVPKLVSKLTESPGQQFSIVAVAGMGGLGKTTLARKVFNHERVKTQFGYHIWVHVSKTFDPNMIFKKILGSQTDEAESNEEENNEVAESKEEEHNEVTANRGAISEKFKKSFKATTNEVDSRQEILLKLQKALKAKTYLLVLDDIWNEDVQKWEDFINALAGVTSMKGNGIILTTRKAQVAAIANPLHTHHLNGLSDEDCWSIIKTKVFGNGDVPPEFETIGAKIARRCQGLPLAAKVVGGVLRDKSEQEWLSIQQKWLTDVEGDNISNILKLSFDNLSSPQLKKCFAYCSVFPKGDRIVKQELIELWMAEGFLQPDGRNDMESVGENVVKILLQNSLLQVAPRDDAKEQVACIMHDLVHDLASSICGINQVRYMSHNSFGESSPIPKETAKCLRTLFFEGDISELKFSDYKSLHVLNLAGCDKLSSSIRKLMHLRNFNISETEIKYLPDSVGELHHLQTLRADTPYLRKLPSTLKYLISLRHLHIKQRVKCPPEMGRLTALQTLTHFTVGRKKGCRIEELGSLKNLKGKLKICSLENVHSKEEAEKAKISQKPDLFELRFEWDWERKGERTDDESVLEGLQPHPNLKILEISGYENVLEGLQPHRNLMKLTIDGFRGKRFPLWALKMAVRDEPQDCWVGLNKLTKITLSWCDECEEIPTLGHLPNLKSLYLKRLRNVKSINSSFYGICPDTTVVFPALERLSLSNMHELKEWAEVEFPSSTNETRRCEVKVFPHLRYLMMEWCNQLRSVPSYFSSCLKRLTIRRMESYMYLGNICGIKLTSLTKLEIEGLDALECLPDWLFYNNQNLSKLKIISCHKLRELPDGLHTLNYLEELSIDDCPNLKSIGYPSGGGQSRGRLRSLHIERCEELIELPREMIESWAPELETLSLKRLKSLQNLPVVIECLAKSARLRELRITGVAKFMATASVESWHLPRLQRIEIQVMSGDMEWLRESKESVDGILEGCCHSLTELMITGVEKWESVPESIQYLTALRWLELSNFGMEELPQWFGNLSSLYRLTLWNCKKLKRLPSVDVLRQLTKLKSLFIIGCPELCIDYELRNFPNLFIVVDYRRMSPESCATRIMNRCLAIVD